MSAQSRRILSAAFQKSLGQPAILASRGGAAGGRATAAWAASYGYAPRLTLTAIALNPALFNDLGYDFGFVPICELVNAPNVIVKQFAAHTAIKPE